jgi:hypothetical protein
MKSFKYYVNLVKANPPYSIKKDKGASEKNKKKAKKFKKKYGFGYEETWSLDNTIACFLVPRLAYLRDNHYGYPSSFAANSDGNEKWTEILNTMVEGFATYVNKEWYELTDEEKEKREKALEYFKEYFDSLWD